METYYYILLLRPLNLLGTPDFRAVQDLQTGEIEHVKSGYLYRKAEAMKFLRDVEEHIKDRKLGKRRVVPWFYWPKTINRRKLERMIPHYVD